MATRPQTPSERSMFMLSAMSTATLSLVFVGSILAVQTNGFSGSPGPLADSCGVSAQPSAQGQGARGTPVFPPGQTHALKFDGPFPNSNTLKRAAFGHSSETMAN